MERRRIKITEIPDHYASTPFKRNDGVRGILYYLCKTPSKEMKAAIEAAYCNVNWMVAQSQYAPENKKPCIFVF